SRRCFLALHRPELQPADRPWPRTDEAVANRPFETVDDLAGTLDRHCPALADDPETIRPTARFNRWPAD
ncbi:MAG: IS630 family transposase, partial [Proteobacteria bacterium]|nr:IS630 family transposase [Pseudomonadota bacterium]